MNAEKVNLDDIERDNLRAEGIAKTGHARPEGTKFLTKPTIGQQEYHVPNQYSGPTNSPVAYATPPTSQNVKHGFIDRAPKIIFCT